MARANQESALNFQPLIEKYPATFQQPGERFKFCVNRKN